MSSCHAQLAMQHFMVELYIAHPNHARYFYILYVRMMMNKPLAPSMGTTTSLLKDNGVEFGIWLALFLSHSYVVL